MKWLKKKLRKWVNEARDYDEEKLSSVSLSRDVESKCDAEPILHFRVFGAVGGKVVEFRRYDRKSDRSDTTSYIITNEQDFGERIAKIATMETLKG